MSILHEAHDIVISGSNFVNSTQNTYIHYGQSGIDILREASTPGAAMDSRDHYDRRCFPGTREQYVADITNWVTASVDTPPSIYWMRGPAGVGKSAIAQTCAENLEGAGYLGAAFFFSAKKYDNPLRLFTTIAYQLAAVLLDYRAVLDDKIFKDKTLVEKRMSSQFRSLIAEPLQELERQGKGPGRRAVFIDGLDECAGADAQAEIIEIIASSIRAGSTPFCWAIFSRSEPRILSTFNQYDISSITRSVELPISCEADGEIELYLRGEFKNILRRQNCLQLSSSWPIDEDIKKLVNAAAGLFAHPAAVLRFVGYPSDWQFQERLRAVLNAILEPNKQSSMPPLAELDALYLLIMSRIPEDILLSAQLLLYWVAENPDGFGNNLNRVTMLCCQLGFSEPVFKRICHHLHAVIAHQEFPEPLSSLDPRIDLKRPFYDQDQWFQRESSLESQLFRVHGLLTFHHKSFYDFLLNPACSSTFCIATPAIRNKLFDRLVQQHHRYASSYVTKGPKLSLAPGVANSSVSLSWPQGNEFVDSFLKLTALSEISLYLSHDYPTFGRLLQDTIPPSSLQKLAELDYHKSLLADMMLSGVFHLSDAVVFGHLGTARVLPHTVFECLRLDRFDAFNPTAFLAMVETLKKAGVIRPFHSQFGSSRAASALHTFSRQKPYGKSSGRYKLGHGDKSVIWYWEFDTEERYFHQFQTVNYAEAVEIYRTEKFRMWEKSWASPLSSHSA